MQNFATNDTVIRFSDTIIDEFGNNFEKTI